MVWMSVGLIYSRDNAADVRCLCPKCLNDYISNPNFAVRRLDPLTAVRDKCDKCNGTGYDYVIYDKMIIEMGLLEFNRLIRIENMNSLVSHLFDRSTALRFHQNVNNEIDK